MKKNKLHRIIKISVLALVINASILTTISCACSKNTTDNIVTKNQDEIDENSNKVIGDINKTLEFSKALLVSRYKKWNPISVLSKTFKDNFDDGKLNDLFDIDKKEVLTDNFETFGDANFRKPKDNNYAIGLSILQELVDVTKFETGFNSFLMMLLGAKEMIFAQIKDLLPRITPEITKVADSLNYYNHNIKKNNEEVEEQNINVQEYINSKIRISSLEDQNDKFLDNINMNWPFLLNYANSIFEGIIANESTMELKQKINNSILSDMRNFTWTKFLKNVNTVFFGKNNKYLTEYIQFISFSAATSSSSSKLLNSQLKTLFYLFNFLKNSDFKEHEHLTLDTDEKKIVDTLVVKIKDFFWIVTKVFNNITNIPDADEPLIDGVISNLLELITILKQDEWNNIDTLLNYLGLSREDSNLKLEPNSLFSKIKALLKTSFVQDILKESLKNEDLWTNDGNYYEEYIQSNQYINVFNDEEIERINSYEFKIKQYLEIHSRLMSNSANKKVIIEWKISYNKNTEALESMKITKFSNVSE